MQKIERLLATFVQNRSIILVVLSLLILEGLFLSRFFKPDLFSWVIEKHLFEVASLAVLIQIVLILWHIANRNAQKICFDELSMEQELLRIAERRDVGSVHLMSCGLRSRQNLVTMLIPHVRVEVLVQEPGRAIDAEDAASTNGILNIMTRDKIRSESLELRLFSSPATIRAAVVCDAKRQPIWAAVSWYVYRLEDNSYRVRGRGNPMFVVDLSTADERKVLLEFCMVEFERAWESATSWQPNTPPV